MSSCASNHLKVSRIDLPRQAAEERESQYIRPLSRVTRRGVDIAEAGRGGVLI
jgi:hypothetical protein